MYRGTYGEAIQNVSSTFDHYYGFPFFLRFQLSFRLLESLKFRIYKIKYLPHNDWISNIYISWQISMKSNNRKVLKNWRNWNEDERKNPIFRTDLAIFKNSRLIFPVEFLHSIKTYVQCSGSTTKEKQNEHHRITTACIMCMGPNSTASR